MDNTNLHKPLYSRMEVAQFLSVSVQTITRMIGRGQLEKIKVGRFVRIPAESLERFILGQYTTACGSVAEGAIMYIKERKKVRDE